MGCANSPNAIDGWEDLRKGGIDVAQALGLLVCPRVHCGFCFGLRRGERRSWDPFRDPHLGLATAAPHGKVDLRRRRHPEVHLHDQRQSVGQYRPEL